MTNHFRMSKVKCISNWPQLFVHLDCITMERRYECGRGCFTTQLNIFYFSILITRILKKNVAAVAPIASNGLPGGSRGIVGHWLDTAPWIWQDSSQNRALWHESCTRVSRHFTGSGLKAGCSVCRRNPWIFTAGEFLVYERLTYSFYPPCQSVCFIFSLWSRLRKGSMRWKSVVFHWFHCKLLRSKQLFQIVKRTFVFSQHKNRCKIKKNIFF